MFNLEISFPNVTTETEKFVLMLQLKLHFLQHTNIRNYLSTIMTNATNKLSSNWFTRIESQLLGSILKMCTSVHQEIDRPLFYAIAVKYLCIFDTTQKTTVERILRDIIFSRNFFPEECLLKELYIQENHNESDTSRENLQNMMQTYVEVLNLKPVSIYLCYILSAISNLFHQFYYIFMFIL